MLELVLVQIRPAPQTRVYDMREALAAGHLQATVQRARYGDALGGHGALLLHGRHQRVHLVGLVLELLGQALDGSLGKLFVVRAEQVTHQTVHNAAPGLARRVAVVSTAVV